jgi:transcriptional regulator with XRE-family HTH domain
MLDERTQKFGHRVLEIRKFKQLTQAQLGELSCLDRTYISGIERGLRNVSLVNILAIADALEVPVYKLFLSEEDFRGK